MRRKVGRCAWELAHNSTYYGLTVYGDAVHEEVARKGGFRMEHGGQTYTANRELPCA